MEFFNRKVTVSNFNERELHHKCFPINFAKFFKTATLKISSKQLFMKEYLLKPRGEVNTVSFIKKVSYVAFFGRIIYRTSRGGYHWQNCFYDVLFNKKCFLL